MIVIKSDVYIGAASFKGGAVKVYQCPVCFRVLTDAVWTDCDNKENRRLSEGENNLFDIVKIKNL
ncbi:hypothetical protein HYT26_00850 [Candidatus Pacearchaeota archaeon]|nr:hypothetical protein [Candidatus Pacearchaeota archaeon]